MKRSLLFLVLAVLAAAALFLPVPWLVVAPGGALSVPARVELAAPADDIDGDLLLTTVQLAEPRAIGALLAWIDDERDLVRREQVIPPEADRDQFFQAQRRVFSESAQVAAAVALRAAGFEVTVTGEGAEVLQVLPDSPADGALEVGDVITEVAGEPVPLATDLIAALGGREAGDTVTLTVRRGGTTTEVGVTLEQLDAVGRPGLGIAVQTANRQIDLPFDVEVDQGRIGGPSAGLMIALTVYDLANDTNLVDGRRIAGTGTIDLDGNVGPVGGVDQKVVAARQAGAEIFLVPPQEAEAARDAAGDDLEVIVVSTFAEAVNALGGSL